MDRQAPDPNDVILWTGGYFDIFEHEREGNGKIHIATIARGLANICRYAGQVDGYYSVAEHSVLMSRMVAEEHAAEALMHDAAEALIGDIRKPLKAIWPEYKALEEKLERFIAQRFGLQYPRHPDIKDADNRIIWLEQRKLYNDESDWGWEEPTADMRLRLRKHGRDGKIRMMEPDMAFAAFMVRAQELGLK